MSTDRELLELAAKAAGIVGEYECWAGQGFMEGIRCKGNPKEFKIWNPLIYDDQALRLAVKLRLNLSHSLYSVTAWTSGSEIDGGVSAPELVDEESRREVATRRAIVRAAAEIGRAMA